MAAAVLTTPDLLPVGVCVGCVDVADDLVSFAAHLRQLARTVNHAAPVERAA
ncbi:hypothetical protein ABT075_28430 [Streptomyces sp. NPDC002677]|uniref:hypothetical protein n=1 Tax=Streptomyces sp. NPDC002677 TaxID=3154774 RepID=UPI00332349BB